MKAVLMLADAAQVADGKLNMLGGGWSVTSGVTPSALAVKIEVPWAESNKRHKLALRLLDADGNEKLALPESTFEVGRPPGIPAGIALDCPVAIGIGPIAPLLTPGERFVWEMSIDGHTCDDWQCSFFVRPAPPSAAAA